MDIITQTGTLSLLIAAVVAMLTRRLRLPYGVGLVPAGIVLALLPFAPRVNLTWDLIFAALLPTLLFEAAFSIHWDQLRRNLSIIIVLATLGVLLSASVTATGIYPLGQCLMCLSNDRVDSSICKAKRLFESVSWTFDSRESRLFRSFATANRQVS